MYFETLQTILRENIIEARSTSDGFKIQSRLDGTVHLLSVVLCIGFGIAAIAGISGADPFIRIAIWTCLLILMVYVGSILTSKAPKEITYLKDRGVLKFNYGMSGWKKVLVNKIADVFFEKDKKGFLEFFIRSKSGKTMKVFKLMANTYNLQNAPDLALALNQTIHKN